MNSESSWKSTAAHTARYAKDAVRTAYLEGEGFRIFRAHNQEIYDNIDGVLDTLLAFVRGEVS